MRVRIDSELAIITLTEANDGNRLDPSILSSLLEAVKKLNADSGVRAIMLVSNGGQGGVFCHGMNLDALLESQKEGSTGGQSEGVELYSSLLDSLAFGPKPVISVLSGSVKAGGVGLVCASDIVIASPETSFELTEVIFGIVPANVYPYFSKFRLSPAKAKFYTLTALPIDAQRAVELDLIDVLVPFADLEKSIKQICKQLWRANPQALSLVKKMTKASLEESQESFTKSAKSILLEALTSPEPFKAIEAMKEGGSPSWFGKFKPISPLISEEQA